MLPQQRLVVGPFRLYQLGATAGLLSSAGSTVGQANRGTRKLNLDRPLDALNALSNRLWQTTLPQPRQPVRHRSEPISGWGADTTRASDHRRRRWS